MRGVALCVLSFLIMSWNPANRLTSISNKRPALEPIQPPIQRVPRALSIGVNRPGGEADHSPPSSVEVKNAWSYTSIPTIRLHSVMLS
jgi:hypothetical protein